MGTLATRNRLLWVAFGVVAVSIAAFGYYSGFTGSVVAILLVLLMAFFVLLAVTSPSSADDRYEEDSTERLDRERLYERESAAAYAASIRVDAGDSVGSSDFGGGESGGSSSGSDSSTP